MTFAYPWALLFLLLLPVLAWWKGKRARRTAFVYSSVQLVKSIAALRTSRASKILAGLRWLVLALLIVALARPRLVEGRSNVKASGIDIVVAMDLSLSMGSEDFQENGQRVNRLYIAQKVLKKFIEGRPNDRIGLVAFSGKAYLVTPPTLDHDFLQQNVDRLNLDTIKEAGTAIGLGLSAALNRLRELDSKSRIVILMTDGQNNTGKVTPLTAADAAKALKVKVYTIGVGTRGLAPMPYPTGNGGKIYQMEPVDIDEAQLTEIANRTGGRYYRADTTETMERIYKEIDQLEKTEIEMKKFQRYTELFPFVLAAGLFILLLEIGLGNTVWRRLP
jgi:Ca-activated chloride channel family protein